MDKKNKFKIIKIILFVLMAALIIYQGQKEIESIDFAKTISLIRSFNTSTIVLFFILGLASIFLMTLYDFVIVNHLKLDIKKLTIFNVSFIANTANNISGLGGLTGASIRAVFFKKRTDNLDDITNYSLLLLPATGVGLSILSILSIVKIKYIEPILQQYKWLYILLVAFLAFLIIYFYIDKIYCWVNKKQYNKIDNETLVVKFKLLAVSFLEWFAAYLFFSFIVKQFNTSISIYVLLGVFTLASISGIASMIPGGAGSFDLIVLLGLKNFGFNVENILAILIIYRTFYYFIPFAIGIIFTLILQLLKKKSESNDVEIKKVKNFIDKTSNFTNLLLRALVFLSGLVLLVSALIPGIGERLKIASELLSFSILQWSHQLSICIGVLLIAISIEIGMKVKRAYKVTFYLLILGAIFTFLKGFDYEEAIFLSVVLLLLYFSKDSFHRKSLPFNWLGTLVNLSIAFICLLIYAKLRHFILIDFLDKYNISTILKYGTLKSNYNGIIAYASLIVFMIIWHITMPKIEFDERYEGIDEIKFNEFLEKNTGHYLTHLILLDDKNIFWAVGSKVAIVYQKSHNIIIVLGDPIGDEKYFSEGISEFQEFIDEYGYKAAFYEVSETFLPIYHDHGYDFFKLGETAIVNLDEFQLVGAKYRDFRNVISRFQRDGYIYELFQSLPDELFGQLKIISDEWLDGRKEMGFSLGSFDVKYLKHSPIALIKAAETNEIIAFASIMPCYDHNQSVSLDLMRFKKEVPNNTMTYLILKLLIDYKEAGYKFFNLGMAPLSNVGKMENAHLSEKLANSFTQYGNHFYSFKGLHNYKDKFYPNWEGRYLAYEDIRLLPSSLIEATILIHSNKEDNQKNE
ncbi:MAG: bifunctional lysylphosphatidylglycerol flippase/synthetase MprF [Sedimentibacter sp.]